MTNVVASAAMNARSSPLHQTMNLLFQRLSAAHATLGAVRSMSRTGASGIECRACGIEEHAFNVEHPASSVGERVSDVE